MKRSTILAGIGAGAALAWSQSRNRSAAPRRRAAADADRHLAVTVLRSPDEVAPQGMLPERLAELGDLIDVQVRPAPGDRGTELHVEVRDDGSIRDRSSGEHPVQRARTALRETKQLLETGFVLSPDRPGTTEATALNAPLRKATELARGEGVS